MESVITRTGDVGWPGYGDPGIDDGPALDDGAAFGDKVKRKSLAESCQKARRDVNISSHPSTPLLFAPTAELSEYIKPIRSSFGSRFRPRKTPSLLILMRQSAFGLPLSGVFFEASVVTKGDGSGWWKYQYRVAQSIMATSLVGLAGALKSLEFGKEIELMNKQSFCRVGFVNR